MVLLQDLFQLGSFGSPLKNPFVDSDHKNLGGYEYATSSSSILSTPADSPGLPMDLQKKGDLSQHKNHSESLKSSDSCWKLIPQQKQFQNHYVRPEHFDARECRLNNEDAEPMSISEFGKLKKKTVFGQIVEAREPKENSNGTWNFHFIIGKNGVLVQVWVFGPKDDIQKFSERIREVK